MNWYYFEKTKYLGLKIPVKIHFRRNIMSQKKAINNWKRAEYLLIKNRKKQQQIQRERELLFRCYHLH